MRPLVAESAVESDQRTVVLTALPAEADAILARTTLDARPVVVVDGRHYYLGSLGGKKVIVAMTGIGMVNATDTTEAALAHFRTHIRNACQGSRFRGCGRWLRSLVSAVCPMVPAIR